MEAGTHDEATAEHSAPSGEAEEDTAPFRLAGSMTILVSDEELENGIVTERARQAALFEAKMRRWMED